MATGDVAPPTEVNGWQAIAQSFMMIIFSEIGDKTFLIAAILAMRHPRVVVFAGAFGSLVVMSILSAELGHLLPTLIPKRWTHALAAVLFLVFGVKMLQEGREMAAGNDKIREEMKEAEEEIEGDEAGHDEVPLEELEEGGRRVNIGRSSPGHARIRSQSQVQKRSLAEGARNFCSLLFGPVFVQAFILTFLGEWGDRSQISTIALGAAHVSFSQVDCFILDRFRSRYVIQNVYLVSLGTIIGHACCTALAVIGGRYVSTKISVKHGPSPFLPRRVLLLNTDRISTAVTLSGSVLFLLFGIIYLYEAFISMDIDLTDFSYAP